MMKLFSALVLSIALWLGQTAAEEGSGEIDWLAPEVLCEAGEGSELLVVGSMGRRALLIDAATGTVRRTIPLPAPASGAVVRGGTAFVCTREPAGRVLEVDLGAGVIRSEYRAGHTPMGPVLSPDGGALYVANRFDGTVARLDLATGAARTLPVIREPVALALSADGARLFAANHLPEVRQFEDEENPHIGAEVTVIDTARWRVIENINLPNGSQGLRGIALSPDGRWAVVTHVLSNYMRPAWDAARGRMNRNAISLLDAATLEWVATTPLDDPGRGAANPWGVAFADGGRRLLATHAGTHELSVIDFPALVERLIATRGATASGSEEELSLLSGIRRRIALPVNGPRALAVTGTVAYVAGYFSDDVAGIDLGDGAISGGLIQLGDAAVMSPARRGELLFNDATWCRGHWQSCASCHPDGRSDTMYWDLLNDGLGNTKNTKSLLMSALSSSVMWRGVRSDVRAGIRGGIEHILFAKTDPVRVEAIAAYLRRMPVVPSPHLDAGELESPRTKEEICAKCHMPGVPRGVLTAAARRGKAIFEGKGGCAECHPHPFFTSGEQADPGLGSGVAYQVPSLVEIWRTAPYLHSGDALTLRETITDYNFLQKRGHTADLTGQELADLLEYLKSL